MKRGLPSLERSLRERVLAEVQHSDTLWKQYVKQRRASRFFSVLRILVSPVVLAGAVLLPACFNLLCIGIGVLQNENPRQDPRILEGNGIELALLLHALLLTSLDFILASALAKELWQSHELAVLAFLPVGDAQHRDKILKQTFWSNALLLSYLASYGYGYWAWSNGFTVAGWAVAAALAVLQGCVGTALAIMLQGRFTFTGTAIVGMCLFVAVVLAGLGGFFFRPYVEGWSWIGMALIPAGWVNLAFQEGLVRNNPAGWLWSIPAIVLLALAARRLIQPFAIREFVFLERNEAEAIPEPFCAELKGPQFRFLPARLAAKPHEPQLSEAASVRRIRQELLADGFAERQSGWLARFILGRLNARERAVIESLLSSELPVWAWTWWWNCMCLGTLASVLLLFIPAKGDAVGLLQELPYLMLYLMFFFGPGFTTGRIQLCPNLWLPIGHGEVSRVLWKIHLLATMCVSPLFFILGVAIGWRVHGQPFSGLIVSAIWVFVGLVVFPFRLMVAICVETSPIDGKILLWRMPLLILLGCAGTVVVVAIFCTLQWKYPLLTVAGGVVLTLSSFGFWHLYCRSFDHWRGDWLPPR